MFEKERVHAHVAKVQYAGTVETPKGEGGQESSPTRKDSKIEVTFRVRVLGDFQEELERRYFPGLSARKFLTEDKTKHYKDQLTVKTKELHLTVYREGKDDSVLSVGGVEIKSPVIVICKGGESFCHVRVIVKWDKTLNILKTLDQCDVEFSLAPVSGDLFDLVTTADGDSDEVTEEEQGDVFEEDAKPAKDPKRGKEKTKGGIVEFHGWRVEASVPDMIKEALEEGETEKELIDHVAAESFGLEAKNNPENYSFITVQHVTSALFSDEENNEESASSESEDQEAEVSEDVEDPFVATESDEEETQGSDDWDPFAEDEMSVEASGEEGTDSEVSGIPKLAAVASERPLSLDQVDFRLSKVLSAKAEEKYLPADPELRHKIGQKAAEIAFERAPKKGVKVQISASDLKEASEQFNA